MKWLVVFYYVFNYNGVYSLARWMRVSWNEKRRVNIPKRTDITRSAAERGQRREIRMEFQRPVRDQS